MPALAALTTFVAGQVAQASQVNGNFAALRTWADNSVVLTDVAKTITASHTFSANQTFSGTITVGTGVTVSAGGVTVTGNSTITGTLGGLTGLTVASGGASITGNSTIAGTLGGLTGLTVASGGASITGNSTITGNLTVTGTLTGAVGASSYTRRTSDVNFTSSTDLALAFAIGATEVWEYEYVLFHTNATGSATASFTVSGPASVSGAFGAFGASAGGGSGEISGSASYTYGGSVALAPMDTVAGCTVIRGVAIGGGTAGNVSITGTVTAGTGVLKTGSYVRYAKVA